MKELPVRRFAAKAAWETWLSKHHESSPGLWLEFAKKGSRVVSLSRADAAVERLHAQRRLAPAGLRQMEAAKRDGRWDAAFFEQLDSQNRYAILYRLHDAKTAETRQRRLTKFIDMLEAGETLYQHSAGRSCWKLIFTILPSVPTSHPAL